MEADFEPLFDILHSEQCSKNQGREGWCFYMHLKPLEVRTQLFASRLDIQQAARRGDVGYVREHHERRSANSSDGELKTLFYIAQANGHVPLITYLRSMSQDEEDPFFNVIYGDQALQATIDNEDQVDGSESARARWEVHLLKTGWERAESQLILQSQIDQPYEKQGMYDSKRALNK